MDSTIQQKLKSLVADKKVPDIKIGDRVRVHIKIEEKGKSRIQVFEGIVIAMKGHGITKTFTVRKISYGIGVEKIFPLYTPTIDRIEIVKRGVVRRSKLYYMRKRVGKLSMKIRKAQDFVEEESPSVTAEEKEEVGTADNATQEEKTSTEE